jgi:hypothetical protein
VRLIAELFARHVPGLDPASVAVSKFSNGLARPDRKVLFLATHRGRLLGVVKMMREARFDDRLREECASQAAAPDCRPFLVPRVLWQDDWCGHFVYCEEAIRGHLLRRRDTETFFPQVYAFQLGCERGPTISVAEVCAILQEGAFDLAPDLVDVRAALLERADSTLTLGFSHGDLTPRNILQTRDGSLYLIDWDRAGRKPVWGVDLARLIALRYDLLSGEHPVAEAAATFRHRLASLADAYGLRVDTEYFTLAYLMERVFDALRREPARLDAVADRIRQAARA